MKQAISYANADSIQAEFFVFTDGNIWQIKRNTAAGWVNYPNIPSLKNNNQTELEFSSLLHYIDEINLYFIGYINQFQVKVSLTLSK